jgi:hypothetical protein
MNILCIFVFYPGNILLNDIFQSIYNLFILEIILFNLVSSVFFLKDTILSQSLWACWSCFSVLSASLIISPFQWSIWYLLSCDLFIYVFFKSHFQKQWVLRRVLFAIIEVPFPAVFNGLFNFSLGWKFWRGILSRVEYTLLTD